jgi:prolyl 4-hydroxylase
MSDLMLQLQAAAASGDPNAQFRLGLALMRNGDAPRARAWYQRAANSGVMEAQRELALLQLFGIGVDQSADKALAILSRCADTGDSDARYWLARRGLSVGDPDEVREAIAMLELAAASGHRRSARALALVRASLGDTESARSMLAASSPDGDLHGAALLQALEKSGPSSKAIRGDHPSGPNAPGLDVRAPVVLNESPYVAIADDVLSPVDCVHLIELARTATLRPALTVHPQNAQLVRNELRTSSSSSIEAFHEDPWAVWLQRRLCALFGADLASAEPLAVLHYAPGQEYRPHRDYLQPSSLTSPDGKRGGQRTHTVFVYLNDVAAGGETAFPELDITIKPQRGRAVLFTNITQDGQPDPRTLHAGCPVIEGEKWLATLWLRERPVRAV